MIEYLVVGDGQMGRAMFQHCKDEGYSVVMTSRKLTGPDILPFDLTQHGWPAFPECRTAVLAAACSRLETCRTRPEETRLVNVTKTAALAAHLSDRGARVVFLSSSHVFDGESRFPLPDDAVSPRTEYGRQKVEAEKALDRIGACTVVRMTKVVHPDWDRIVGWRDRLLSGQPVKAYADMVVAPIFMDQTVRAIIAISRIGLKRGVWHLSASSEMSYLDMARTIAVRVGASASLVEPVSAVGTGLEHLPKHATLGCVSQYESLGIERLTAKEVVARAVPDRREPIFGRNCQAHFS